jgi:hypothetical protein
MTIRVAAGVALAVVVVARVAAVARAAHRAAK